MNSISIITVVYNNNEGLKRTIHSLRNQKDKDFEYIIIDGGSNDGTLDTIRENQDIISTWISERDGGIYDAMNKGLEKAKGEIIGILNSGDLYAQDVLQSVKALFENTNVQLTYGNTIFFSQKNEILREQNGNWDKNTITCGFGFMHPSVFIRSDVYKKCGVFDLNYKFASDIDLILRIERLGIPFTKGNYKVYMEAGGTTERNFYKSASEFCNILLKGNYIDKITYFKLKINLFIKSLIKKIISTESVHKTKLQLIFFALATFNFALRISVFFCIKKIALKTTGISIGNKSYIHRNTRFLGFGKLQVGNNTTINRGCTIDNRGRIIIGDNVSIAHECKIYTLGHDLNDFFFAGKKKEVVINSRVVIFANAMIMPGVELGEGCVVLPGSVVAKSIEPYSIVGGNPAVKKGEREKDLYYNLNYGYWFGV